MAQQNLYTIASFRDYHLQYAFQASYYHPILVQDTSCKSHFVMAHESHLKMETGSERKA